VSIRTWQAHPSAEIDLATGRYPVVTQEDLLKAVVDGAVMVDRAGGCLIVAVTRIPTGVPHEMVTTGALVTWQDRTNAKAQPEPSVIPAATLRDGDGGEIDLDSEGHTLAERAGEKAADLAGSLDDGLHVDPDAVDESDPELQAALGG
jgi:hypothetical protein